MEQGQTRRTVRLITRVLVGTLKLDCMCVGQQGAGKLVGAVMTMSGNADWMAETVKPTSLISLNCTFYPWYRHCRCKDNRVANSAM